MEWKRGVLSFSVASIGKSVGAGLFLRLNARPDCGFYHSTTTWCCKPLALNLTPSYCPQNEETRKENVRAVPADQPTLSKLIHRVKETKSYCSKWHSFVQVRVKKNSMKLELRD